MAPAATAMAPGISGGGTGRPRPQPLIHHSAVLIKREEVPAVLTVGDQPEAKIPSTFDSYSRSLPAPFASPRTGKPFSFPTVRASPLPPLRATPADPVRRIRAWRWWRYR